MIISVRLEGGLGDVLLGNRFVAALRDKYPEARFRAFLDTEGNQFQAEGLRATYEHFYEAIVTIPSKKFVKCEIESQFGREEYKGALENVPNIWREAMLQADKFYDLHIDALKWLDYDFDWLRFHRFFPRPRFSQPFKGVLPEQFIAVNLVSESSVAHRLQGWYIERLVKELSAILPVVAVATERTASFYDKLPCQIVVAPIGEALELISHSKVVVSTDSGLRYIAFGCDIPVLTFSAQSNIPHQVLPSHQLRWLINPELCFPLNYSSSYVSGIAKKIVENKGYALLPASPNFDSTAIRRSYKVLNENIT